jgi:hypothetical protein
MRDLLAYAFHRGEALAYRNAGMHDKSIAHTRRARYYRSRFGPPVEPDAVMTDGDLGLDWGEDVRESYKARYKHEAGGKTWTKLNEGSSAHVFGTKDTVAKIFKVETHGMQPTQQGGDDDFMDDSDDEAPPTRSTSDLDAAARANVKRKAEVEAEVKIMLSVTAADVVPKFFGYVYFTENNEKVVTGYTMERIGKNSLLHHMGIHYPRLDEHIQHELIRVIEGVCMSVTCLDIKPANFAITEEGKIRMIDLGDDYCSVGEKDDKEDYYKARVLFCILIFCTSVCTPACNGNRLRSTVLIPSLTVLIAKLMEEDKAESNIALFNKTIDRDDRYTDENFLANIARGECTRIIAIDSKLDRKVRLAIAEEVLFLPSHLLRVFSAYIGILAPNKL